MTSPEIEALADEIRQDCADEANALLLLGSLDNPRVARFMARHRAVVDAAVNAGVAGTLQALERRGLLIEDGEPS